MFYLLLLIACTSSEQIYNRGYAHACDDVHGPAYYEGLSDGETCDWGYVELAATCTQDEEPETWKDAWYLHGYEDGCFACAPESYNRGYDRTCVP